MASRSIEEIIKQAVEAGRLSAETTSKDAYKATERRLYALPVLRDKRADDLERLAEIRENGLRHRSKDILRFNRSGSRLSMEEVLEAVTMDLEASIAATEYEIETLERALSRIADDPYYRTVTGRYIDAISDEEIAEDIPCETTTVWRNRKRLVQRLAVWLYGVTGAR